MAVPPGFPNVKREMKEWRSKGVMEWNRVTTTTWKKNVNIFFQVNDGGSLALYHIRIPSCVIWQSTTSKSARILRRIIMWLALHTLASSLPRDSSETFRLARSANIAFEVPIVPFPGTLFQFLKVGTTCVHVSRLHSILTGKCDLRVV